jgi:hypothetical protein
MLSSGTNGNRTVVRGLGEIALRVNNLDTEVPPFAVPIAV